jgi:hypothetical protein
MLNGKLVDETILLMAETLAKSDQEMQNNMAAISACSSKSKNLFLISFWGDLPWKLIINNCPFKGEWTNVTQPLWFSNAVKSRHQISWPI